MEGRIPGPRVPGSLYRERLERGEGHDSWSRLYILNEIADAEADAETDADKLTKEDPVYFLVALDVADGFREKRELRETGRETSGVREIWAENVSCASLLTIDDSSKSMPSFSIILLTLYIITYLNLYV